MSGVLFNLFILLLLVLSNLLIIAERKNIFLPGSNSITGRLDKFKMQREGGREGGGEGGREGGREGGGEGELSGDGYQHGLWASGTLSVSPGKEDSVNEMHISKLKR